jgi:CBS domain-containing protein
MLVRDLMSGDVQTLTPETPLRDAAATLISRDISGAPVCDVEGHVVGVLSESDIIFKERGAETEPSRLLSWLADAVVGGAFAKQAARTAGEAMTSPAIVVAPNSTVAVVARVMTERGVNRLPVVENGQLVGIVTRTDLVRAFSRPDEEIREELADMVLHQLWIPLEYVQIAVDDGQVTLDGQVETRTEAELVPAFAARVPGVVSVESRLGWEDDDLERRKRVPVLPRRV